MREAPVVVSIEQDVGVNRVVSAELAGMFRNRIPMHAFYDASKNLRLLFGVVDFRWRDRCP